MLAGFGLWAFLVAGTAGLFAAFVAFLVPTALSLVWLGPVLSAFQHLVTPNMRATASAIFLFINNLIGIGLGNLVIGAISDNLVGRFGLESLRNRRKRPETAADMERGEPRRERQRRLDGIEGEKREQMRHETGHHQADSNNKHAKTSRAARRIEVDLRPARCEEDIVARVPGWTGASASRASCAAWRRTHC